MQKPRWILLSLLVIVCSYHIEVSCMEGVIEKEIEKTELFDEESPFVSQDSQENAAIQDFENKALYRERYKKCSRRCWEESKYQCKICLSDRVFWLTSGMTMLVVGWVGAMWWLFS